MKTTPNPFLVTLAVSAALLAQAKSASNQPEDRSVARANGITRRRNGSFAKAPGARASPISGARSGLIRRIWAARHLWSAVVYGGGDRNTLPELVCGRRRKSTSPSSVPMDGAFSWRVRTRPRACGMPRPARQSASPCGTRMKSSRRCSVPMARALPRRARMHGASMGCGDGEASASHAA